MGDFSGIDPSAMANMIASLGSSADSLNRSAASLRADFSWYGLDSSGLGEIITIAGWAHDQLPMLRRRQGLAAALGREDPKVRMVQLPEPVALTSDQARQQGKDLADQMNGIKELDEAGGKRMHEIALQLAAHKDDPDYVTAFYANLQPPMAQTLPSLLAATGSKTARDDVQVFSHAFGTAVSANYPAPGFDKVKASFTQPLPEGDYGAAWNRLVMLQWGDFPADWLSKVARASVLDNFAKDHQQDFRGGGLDAMQLGVSDDSLALCLDALGRNGAAARDALTHMGEPDHGHPRQENIKSILDYSKGIGTGDDIQEALGHALVAGSGVQGNFDANGNFHVTADPHTKEESDFAFDTIMVVSHDSGHLTNLFKPSMGLIAASYAPEILTGSRTDDARMRDSSLDMPANFDALPGVRPGFYLSPEDTYRFLETFADDDRMTGPFDEAMGDLQHRVLVQAAQADQAAVKAGQPDPQNFELAAYALGNTAQLEFQAEKHVRGKLDEEERQFREHFTQVLTFGLELYGEPEAVAAKEALKYSWRVGMFALKEAGFKGYVNSSPDRTTILEDKHLAVVEAARYQMAAALVDAGWPTTPPPPEIMKDGKMMPFEELAQDDRRLKAFYQWADANRGPGSFDQKGDLASGLMTTSQAEDVAHKVDGE